MTIKDQAKETYLQYMHEGLSMHPPFKGYGMKVIEFMKNEPELYKVLFMNNENMEYDEYLRNQWEVELLVPFVEESFDLNEKDAYWFIKTFVTYAHGLCSILLTNHIEIDHDELITSFGRICRGLIMQLKSPSDDRIHMDPSAELIVPDSINGYIKMKKNSIIGYGANKELYQIRLEAILYFEAVGENVFAYTKENVYEIKNRLYQVEEHVKSFSFERASKSLIVNIKKIEYVKTVEGGKGEIHLNNGELVMSSRNYYKNIVEKLKSTIE